MNICIPFGGFSLRFQNFEIYQNNEVLSHSKCHYPIMVAALAFLICTCTSWKICGNFANYIKFPQFFLPSKRGVQITEGDCNQQDAKNVKNVKKKTYFEILKTLRESPNFVPLRDDRQIQIYVYTTSQSTNYILYFPKHVL